MNFRTVGLVYLKSRNKFGLGVASVPRHKKASSPTSRTPYTTTRTVVMSEPEMIKGLLGLRTEMKQF